MKKKVGRPNLGKNAKGVLLAVKVSAVEAKQIDAAVKHSGHTKPEWIRKTLLSAANMLQS